MRNAILVLLAGPILFGCLDSGEPTTATVDNGFAGDPLGNRAPTISGNPPTGVTYGDTYAFKPNAGDADGDPLTFSVENRPGWASFNSSTGEITGQPTLGDVGVYDNILISTSDGDATSSLRAFSVTVSQTALGAITLSWVAPTQNSDGSPLMDLAGYKIYYRKSSGSYVQEVRIDNPSISTYVVDQLSPDTYYFAATAFNTSGMESSFSAEVARTVN
jgi:hypothetical protein